MGAPAIPSATFDDALRAKGAIALKENDFDTVIQIIEAGLEEIRQFYRDHDRSDLLDQSGEIISLESWLEEIRSKRPMSPREKLELALNEAVQNEDYEKAAQVRDALKNLK